MPRQRLLKRCATLELVAQELRRPQQQAEERHQRWVDNVMKLFAVFPEDRHEELLAWLKGDRWESSALAELLNWITTGCWQPVPIPSAVADVFLTEPWAQPRGHCSSCATLLPAALGDLDQLRNRPVVASATFLFSHLSLWRHNHVAWQARGHPLVVAGAGRAALDF